MYHISGLLESLIFFNYTSKRWMVRALGSLRILTHRTFLYVCCLICIMQVMFFFFFFLKRRSTPGSCINWCTQPFIKKSQVTKFQVPSSGKRKVKNYRTKSHVIWKYSYNLLAPDSIDVHWSESIGQISCVFPLHNQMSSQSSCISDDISLLSIILYFRWQESLILRW